MTLTLQQLQQAFMDELSGKPSEAFQALVVDNGPDGRMNKARRIDIYQRNHIGARASGLGTSYPVCQQILGEDTFYRLASDYVATFPSNHWDLNFHGADFNQFLAVQCDRIPAFADLFYLPELARLEWLFHISYYAQENQAIAVQNQDPEALIFHPDSSLRLYCSELPVYQIWQNNREGQGEKPVENNQSCYYHLIFREEFFPKIHSLSQSQYQLLNGCLAGKSLAELAEVHGETVAENIPLFIEQRWLALGN
jgi:hypothetical protein